jgi:predicted permease
MRRLLRRVWYLLRRPQFEADLAEELDFHRAMKQHELEEAGLEPREAAVAGRRALGSATLAQDRSRDVWVPRWLQGLGQDFRLAVRMLRSTAIVTTAAILSLALGIGANTAIFSLVSSLLLRSLPVADPERLAMVSTSASSGSRPQYSYATFDQIRRYSDIFAGALAYTDCCGAAILSVGREHYSVDRQFVSGDFFTTLGVRAFRGRMLTPDDDAPGASEGPVAVLSYRFWHARFGARDDVIGAPIVINRIPVTVVGIMPPTFFGVEVGRVLDIAMPSRLAAQFTSTPFDDDTVWLNIMVRLRPGLSVPNASAALRAVQPHIRAGATPANLARQAFLQDPLTLEPAASGRSMLRQRFERPLLAIFAVVALVLFVACANIGNLLLARGMARRHELSVRVALGATRWQLVRQLFAESALLSAIAAALGLALAPYASGLVVSRLSTARAPIALDLTLNGHVLTFAVVTTAFAAILFGIAPAFRATRVAPVNALNAQGRTIASDGHFALSSSLVVAQIVLSLLMVVTAGLFVQTFERLARVPLGFDRDGVLVVSVNAPTVTATDRRRLFGRLVQAVTEVPGVKAAGGSMNPPLIGSIRGDSVVSPPGTSAPTDAGISEMDLITPGWMAAYRTGIRAGRDVDERDTLAAPRVMLVNEAFVRQVAVGHDVVGTTFAVASRLPPSSDFPMGSKTIIGVVGDTVPRSLREPVRPTMYVPLSQWEWPLLQYTFYIGVRSIDSPARLAGTVEAALLAINDDLTLTAEPLTQQVDESLATDRVLAALSGFFGMLGLLVAGLGLYGVTAYAVARRRAEIGIRMALGAAPARVLRLVLSRVLLLVGIGMIGGTAVSLWASRFVAALLYGLEPRDPATLIGAIVVLTSVGLLAGSLPAWRASRIDPAVVLRES